MRIVIFMLLCAGFIMSCGGTGGYYKFTEPEDGESMIVVGRIIVEDNYYTEHFEVITAGIEVAVYGKTEDGQKLALWTQSDKNGYFALANVPKGEYTLKGFRATLLNGTRVTISNPLLGERKHFHINQNENILFEGEYFAFESTGRVISLKHNLFRLNPQQSMFPLESKTLQILEKVKLVDDRILTDEPVELYFVGKYPESEWTDELIASAKVNRQAR